MRGAGVTAGALAGVLAGALPSLSGCSFDAGNSAYADAARQTWRTADTTPLAPTALMAELVRCATLAPSSHNTQCWKFRVDPNAITILPDLSRRCPAVDPDDHHLFVSLGCAAENLCQAAQAHGLRAHPQFDAAAGGSVRIALEAAPAVASPLFGAITRRQSTRAVFDGQALPQPELALLEQAATAYGVGVLMLTDKPSIERVLELVVQANTAQMGDPAFVDELKAWIRFSDDEAVRTGDGLFTRSSGNPALPRWLASPLFRFVFTTAGENDKYAAHIRSSAGIAVFTSGANDKAHWVDAGRSFERFALQAAALGIRTAFVNQPVEVAALRPQFAGALGLGGLRPDLVVRFGKGPELPRSLRRPVAAVWL